MQYNGIKVYYILIYNMYYLPQIFMKAAINAS